MVKNLHCQCWGHKRHGLDPWVRKTPGGGYGNPLQYSCLENPMDRGAQQATVHGVTRVPYDLVTKPPPPRTNPDLNRLPFYPKFTLFPGFPFT